MMEDLLADYENEEFYRIKRTYGERSQNDQQNRTVNVTIQNNQNEQRYEKMPKKDYKWKPYKGNWKPDWTPTQEQRENPIQYTNNEETIPNERTQEEVSS